MVMGGFGAATYFFSDSYSFPDGASSGFFVSYKIAVNASREDAEIAKSIFELFLKILLCALGVFACHAFF